MKAEIICVGTELLLGDIINTNATWLANQLKDLGIDLYYISTVGDNRRRMEEVFKTAYQRSDLVIITGGLGPTEDDLTREVVSAVTGRRLRFYQELADQINEKFKKFKRKMTPNNLRQAYLPEGAEVIKNRVGTAPGLYLKVNNTIFVALPGVPREMKINFTEEVLPRLKKELPEKGIILSRLLRICGIGESAMEEKVKDIIQNQSNPTIAPLAGNSEVYLKVTAKAASKKEAEALLKDTVDQLYQRLGMYIYGENDETLELVVGKILKKHGLKLAIAESCTGGLIGHRITNIPGSSDYFERGFVTYSNEAKIEELGVPEDVIVRYGAVSPETAKAMAEGVLENSRADIAVAVTGIAGPGGGTPEKPVGLVYCAIADKSGRVDLYDFHFWGEREWIKYSTSQYTLYHLWKYLINKFSVEPKNTQ
ncbi:competence/damage-inducible protein A [Anoxybacter fermentans]|uniref:Putative competence-damage inducible protein n=1 Tax=Anoxybacter fermentans TaxID=1323375 RepID=A0A3S9SWD0_9FIRM|nr:competence/damage-inducible protein A [Anoxybacter fermentans]AZR72562.1 competence/damage-inducible protein A [Anoxybacter fermentans]